MRITRGLINKLRGFSGARRCRCGKLISANKTHCYSCLEVMAKEAADKIHLDLVTDKATDILQEMRGDASAFERQLNATQARIDAAKLLVQLKGRRGGITEPPMLQNSNL